uniref:Uncharacterized protein n=1 Tax=Nelumbo nucifera TaxID=4432 RepID=A0A822Z6S2_NELNU|nr:TPA_asm: hypothetical protein HUJ06_000284 [Nelumbo nucifera]
MKMSKMPPKHKALPIREFLHFYFSIIFIFLAVADPFTCHYYCTSHRWLLYIFFLRHFRKIGRIYMATVLELVTVPRPGFRMALSLSPMASLVTTSLNIGKVYSLPEFKGLRIQSHPLRRTSALVSMRNTWISR